MSGQEQRSPEGSGEPARGHCQAKAAACLSREAPGCGRPVLINLPPSPAPAPTLPEAQDRTFSEARELSGTPFPYFPEMIPQASGDHVIAPTPTEQRNKLLVQIGIKSA